MEKYIPDGIISFEKINEYLKSINKPELPFNKIDLTHKSIAEKEELIKRYNALTNEWLMRYIGIIER